MPEQKPQPGRPAPGRPAPGRPAPARPEPARAAPAGPTASAPALNPKDEDPASAAAQEKHQRRLALLKRSQDLTK